MDDHVFEEIANELKALNQGALNSLKKGDLQTAELNYQKAIVISEKFNYYEGIALNLFNLANLYMVRGELTTALKNAAASRDIFDKIENKSKECCELLERIVALTIKQGINCEKKGEFIEAIKYFEASLPFIEGEKKVQVSTETELLRGFINEGYRENSSSSQGIK